MKLALIFCYIYILEFTLIRHIFAQFYLGLLLWMVALALGMQVCVVYEFIYSNFWESKRRRKNPTACNIVEV